jgi:UDP-GlcNAc:undecaprenyl-phosphate GlcNAc-1-phosphate transferase
MNGDRTLTAYIVASFLLVGIGAVDDRYGLGWKIKLAGNAAAATIVMFGGNAVVHHIGTSGVLGSVDLGWYGIPLTYLGIIGVTNAVNLLDGLNGLAGGVSLLGFLFMGIAAWLAGNVQAAVICFAFVGALGAFLRFNFPHARIFMGDSGSLFLGFSLSFMAVLLTQNATSPLEPMFPVLVLLLPIFDALRVIFVRLLNRKSPFHADNLHLHYLMVQRNFSPVNAVLLLWSMAAACGVTALALADRTSASYLFVVIYVSLFLGLFALGLTQGPQVHEKAHVKISEFAGHRNRPSLETMIFSRVIRPVRNPRAARSYTLTGGP